MSSQCFVVSGSANDAITPTFMYVDPSKLHLVSIDSKKDNKAFVSC
ncbi:MAG: hypothetical protein M3264_09380 [Thermoproteota archaeon]|nr:hypothetical protein [Thermoproteota archaeon]